MKPLLCILAAGAMLAGCSKSASVSDAEIPSWLEQDSAAAIHSRLLADFSLTMPEAAEALQEKIPGITPDSIRALAKEGIVELMTIDGTERMHRKSVRNISLLHPALRGTWTCRGAESSEARRSYADSVIRASEGLLADGGAHRVHYRFSIDVPYDPVLRGDTLRVWMPYPIESQRQRDIRLISASGPYVISTPEQSVHRTIYFEAPVSEGDTTRFEYEAEFVTSGEYFAPGRILADMKPYDKESDLYRRYTVFEAPHIVGLDSLARQIVGAETNPFRQSELVYDYIVQYPWAGAREYSTIPCIPRYVLETGHGDCGQVSLLYISLMRSLGVPARWESGWMLHPGEKNLHDWAEVYFEGVGWVPVDVSFGRYTNAASEAVRNFYSTGMDAHRFAANQGVCGEFFPPKRFVRSETVDAQMGEVESSRGNLFYPGWDQHLELISVTPETVTK